MRRNSNRGSLWHGNSGSANSGIYPSTFSGRRLSFIREKVNVKGL